MAEFEHPRAKALSDAELARVLQTFPSDASGIELAGKLMAEQQKLREQDAAELQAWIELLRARDDEQSRKILADSMAKIFPPEPLEISGAMSEPPVLTSQLPIITRRGRVANRVRTSQALRHVTTALLLGVSNVLVLSWLEVEGLAAIAATNLGLAVAVLFSVPLKRHLLHPILRAAAVFGGVGVYAFAGLVLGATSLALLVAFESESDLWAIASVGPYSAIAVLVVAVAAMIGQLTPVRFGSLALAIPALGAGFMLVSTGLKTEFSITFPAGWYWGAAAVAVVSTLVLLVATPHTKLNYLDASWFVPLSTLLSAGLFLFDPFSQELALTIAIFGLMLGLSLSGRDLAGGGLGRLAGLALLIGLAISPIAAELSGVAIAFVSCSFALMLLDQLFRSSPLHIASLDTSYGFYGSVSVTSWLALVLAGVSGSSWITGLLPELFNHLEWSLVLGLGIGVVMGLLRIPIIRRQDHEIRNVDSSSGNIENLLGL